MKLTRQLIDQGKSARGGWNAKQLAVLGIAWPPLKGWPARLEGQEISDEQYQQFLQAGGQNVSQDFRHIRDTSFREGVSRTMAEMDNVERGQFLEWVESEHYRLARIENARNKSAESFANELYQKTDRNLS